MNLVTIVEITRAVQQTSGVAGATVRLGTGLGAALKEIGVGTGGLRAVTVSMEGGATASKGTAVVASAGAKALAGVAAAISVADCVWSWAADSDLTKQVKECIGLVQRSVNDLHRIIR